MSTHNVCFRGEIRKILCGYPLLSVGMPEKDDFNMMPKYVKSYPSTTNSCYRRSSCYYRGANVVVWITTWSTGLLHGSVNA